jgi:hypothetical protein
VCYAFDGLGIGWLFLRGISFACLRCCWLDIWMCLLFLVVCRGADCVCHARFAGWLCGGAASWVVAIGASSFRHSMAVVWGGLGDGIDIESWLILDRLELLCE